MAAGQCSAPGSTPGALAYDDAGVTRMEGAMERVQDDVARCAVALQEVGRMVTVWSLQAAAESFEWTPAHTMVARWYVRHYVARGEV